MQYLRASKHKQAFDCLALKAKISRVNHVLSTFFRVCFFILRKGAGTMYKLMLFSISATSILIGVNFLLQIMPEGFVATSHIHKAFALFMSILSFIVASIAFFKALF